MTAPPDCTILDKYPPSAGNTILGAIPPLLHDDQAAPLLRSWYTEFMCRYLTSCMVPYVRCPNGKLVV
jgi:hypothetical protein